MITNIIDRRKHPQRFKKINAIIEDAWHDNSMIDADQAPHVNACSYDEREHVSLSEAVIWANATPGHLTLYIYDPEEGLYPAHGDRHISMKKQLKGNGK
jgi:hypothetical protein